MFLRSLAVWFVIIAVETVHGILRRIWIVPITGELQSNQIGTFFGSVLILVVVWMFFDWIKADTVSAKLRVGFFWCLLTFGFEVGLGLAVGYRLQQILVGYNLAQGGLMLFGMAILFFSLIIVSKLRGS